MVESKHQHQQKGEPSLFLSAFQRIHEFLGIQDHDDQGQGNQKMKDSFLKESDMGSNYQRQISSYWEFLIALPWKEPWMVGLMTFHIVCCVCVILTRNHFNLQYVMFFGLLILVYLSERLNQVAADNWRLFAKENYFDSNGLFTSTVFSGPVLLNCILFIILWLQASAKTLIQVKRHEIAVECEKQKKEDKKSK